MKQFIRSLLLEDIEDDTPILPFAVADNIINNVTQYFSNKKEFHKYIDKFYKDRNKIADYLSNRANVIYANNTKFKKDIKKKGTRGRDTLYVFMRHWLSAYMDKNYRELYKELPASFKNGRELK